MTARMGQQLVRTIQTAAKEHKCFGCDYLINQRIWYIKDSLLQVVGYREKDKFTLMTLAWHLKCAPEDKASALKIIKDATAEHAKHPSRTGAEYEDA